VGKWSLNGDSGASEHPVPVPAEQGNDCNFRPFGVQRPPNPPASGEGGLKKSESETRSGTTKFREAEVRTS
jgi:hypothetical protein